MQNAESDTDRGDHYKSKEGIIALIIARFSAAKFLEAIEETRYRVPAFIRLLRDNMPFFRKYRLKMLCAHVNKAFLRSLFYKKCLNSVNIKR